MEKRGAQGSVHSFLVKKGKKQIPQLFDWVVGGWLGKEMSEWVDGGGRGGCMGGRMDRWMDGWVCG